MAIRTTRKQEAIIRDVWGWSHNKVRAIKVSCRQMLQLSALTKESYVSPLSTSTTMRAPVLAITPATPRHFFPIDGNISRYQGVSNKVEIPLNDALTILFIHRVGSRERTRFSSVVPSDPNFDRRMKVPTNVFLDNHQNSHEAEMDTVPSASVRWRQVLSRAGESRRENPAQVWPRITRHAYPHIDIGAG
ncbi:hypothetical protein NE237_000398 [Protea cynaroides]|uniref:Uncharacterized protein n=1 Tax=Protea cynaroides TaxID=273540 RepID=A0A9Q0KR48_9MAGN|nr:hypothetical protein NE237_000398 [Protea cynaroides]